MGFKKCLIKGANLVLQGGQQAMQNVSLVVKGGNVTVTIDIRELQLAKSDCRAGFAHTAADARPGAHRLREGQFGAVRARDPVRAAD